VLHYRENSRQLQDGELLLIDAAASTRATHRTSRRTFPVNGRSAGRKGRSTSGARGAGGVSRRGAPRRGVPRLPQDRGARAPRRATSTSGCAADAGRGAGDRRVQAVLHASRGPLARAWTSTTPVSIC
jgi:hypothetical protein